MSTPKILQWKTIQAMLDACAGGWTFKDKTHRRWVYWNNRYTTLPLGPHGQRKNPEIETGKVRQLVWALGIPRECAQDKLGCPVPARP